MREGDFRKLVRSGAARLRPWVTLGGLLATLLTVSHAQASDEFPEALREAVGMECTPQCIVCHQDNNGGAGTFTKAFGLATDGAGLAQGDAASVRVAIEALVAPGNPSLAMNEYYIGRLKLGLDPNTPETDKTSICQPTYGCGARIAPAVVAPADSAATGAALLTGVVFVGLFLRRKRAA